MASRYTQKRSGLEDEIDVRRSPGLQSTTFQACHDAFPARLRAMLHAWETYGLGAVQTEYEVKYEKNKHRAPWRVSPAFQDVVKGKIEYLGMVKGLDDMTYLRFLDRLERLVPRLSHGRGTPRELLLKRLDRLLASKKFQKRGYLLQDLLNDAFKVFCIPAIESFTRNKRGEQIDGAFELDGRNYLVECKWQKKRSDYQQVGRLVTKLSLSGGHPMGVFLSINGWSRHVPRLLKQDPLKRVILMDGHDLRRVLNGHVSLAKLIRAKVRHLETKTEPFLGVDDMPSSP